MYEYGEQFVCVVVSSVHACLPIENRFHGQTIRQPQTGRFAPETAGRAMLPDSLLRIERRTKLAPTAPDTCKLPRRRNESVPMRDGFTRSYVGNPWRSALSESLLQAPAAGTTWRDPAIMRMHKGARSVACARGASRSQTQQFREAAAMTKSLHDATRLCVARPGWMRGAAA